MITILPGPIINFTVGLRGTYIIFIEINKEIPVTLSRKKIIIEPGYYLYVGSAFGMGGLSSRLHRHIRKSKKQHWHIDQITLSEFSVIEGIGIILDKKIECQISRLLTDLPSFIPIVGFGNSDCNSCPSHFFQILNYDTLVNEIS